MLTSLAFLNKDQKWPPRGEGERLQRYEDNRLLFDGLHDKVFKDWNRILREDQQAEMVLVFNWHKRLSKLWADLLLGEPFTITAGNPDSPEQKNCDRLVSVNGLDDVCYQAIIDWSRFGVGILKPRYANRGIIEVQPPSCWFPVVDPTNVKNIIAHVLAWSWVEESETMMGGIVKNEYLQYEIHEPGRITTRRHRLDGGIIGPAVAVDGLQEVVLTGIDDFLVVPFNNLVTSDRATGYDDYSDLDGILQELEIRYSQVSRILDKHSDPNMYGPESALEMDPETHQYRFKAGGKYFPLDSAEDAAPGYLVWDGQLKAAFEEIDRLMEQLYFLSETSPAAFGQLKSGLAESGTALRRLMMATLAKVNRARQALDPAVKKALALAAELEVKQGYPGAVKLESISIDWQDGLPADEKEEHEIENNDYLAGTVSLETILKKRGLSGQTLDDELARIKESQGAQVEPPNISMGG